MSMCILNLLGQMGQAVSSWSEGGETWIMIWKYYLESLKAGGKGGAEGQGMAYALGFRMPEISRREAGGFVRGLLLKYRKQDGQQNAVVTELMKAHGEYCLQQPESSAAKMRHNAMVYRYMLEAALHGRAVAVKMGISKSGVYKNIAQAVDEMTVLCFGLPAVPDMPGTWKEGVKSLIRNYPLLKRAVGCSRPLACKEWQQEREKCLEITVRAMSGLERVVHMYNEFIAGSGFPDEQGRPLGELKTIYLDGQMAVADAASLFQVSESCVYADIKKIQERFVELFEVTDGKWQEGLKQWKN